MDNASDYGSEDSRFDSWQPRIFMQSKLLAELCVLIQVEDDIKASVVQW